jgi:ribosomal-protein-alanine N-acetyltransferase
MSHFDTSQRDLLHDSAALETERLRLRPVVADDLDHFAALYADPDVMRFIGLRGPLKREQARERLDFMLDHWRRHGFGMWTLWLKAGGDFVGRCSLRYLEESPEVELGYTLAKRFWGQGFATEASRAVVRHAFGALGLRRLVAIADPANVASVNVMRKIGMIFERLGRFYGTECVLFSMGQRPPPPADWPSPAGPL